MSDPARTALVTGASSGIGRAIAAALGARGYRLCLVGRDRARLETAAAEASAAVAVLVRATDITRAPAREALLAAVEEGLGGVDILVHAAGVIRLGGDGTEAPVDDDAQYATNYTAPRELTRLFLPGLIHRRGEIVFINSSAGLLPAAGATAYSASKQALRAFADSLRQEVNPKGVRVLSVYPGRTATPMQAAIFESEGRDYRPELLLQPEDVASMVVAALSLPRTAEVTDLQIRPMNKL